MYLEPSLCPPEYSWIWAHLVPFLNYRQVHWTNFSLHVVYTKLPGTIVFGINSTIKNQSLMGRLINNYLYFELFGILIIGNVVVMCGWMFCGWLLYIVYLSLICTCYQSRCNILLNDFLKCDIRFNLLFVSSFLNFSRLEMCNLIKKWAFELTFRDSQRRKRSEVQFGSHTVSVRDRKTFQI